jgi:hypothetical protein
MKDELFEDKEIVELKKELQNKIVKAKHKIKQLNKELTKTQNLDSSIIEDKESRLEKKSEELDLANKELVDLQSDLADIKRNQQDEEDEYIDEALDKVRNTWIPNNKTGAYIIKDQQFVFIQDYSTVPEKQNIQICEYEPARFSELLAKDLGVKSWHLPSSKLKNLFNEMNRTFNFSRFSIDPSIWQRRDVYLPIQHMEPHFINNAKLTAEQIEEAKTSLPFFDILMYSLSGGKAENQEHIERWILHKIINYKKAVTTPDLVIVGHVGGNGKGILQAIIRLMLPAMLSGKANSKTLNGNFNAIMLGKLIVFFDDQNSKEIPLDVVKQLAGSETMIFEPKGKDQYEGEKTHSSAWFSQTLPFRLTPAGQEGGVDRRFSIMATNITFLESIRKYYQDELGHEMTVEASKDVAETVVSKFLLNRLCVATWFKELQRKYPDVNESYTLKPLHGEDYHYFLENQRNNYETIWHDLITPVLKEGGCVPMFVIKELLRHMEDKLIADKTINSKFKKLSAENKLEIVTERLYVDIYPALVNGKKQCNVIRLKDDTLFKEARFNWGLVSNIQYSVPSIGKDLIADDNLIFGVKVAVDDEIESIKNVFDFDINSEKSWEEL